MLLKKEDLLSNEKLITNVVLLIPLALAFFLRVIIIGEYGLSEDEILKALASQSYRDLKFSSNAQHPALMKLLFTLSVLVFGETEFALRFPNVLFSALTIYPLFYISRELFDDLVGYLACFLWAVDIPVISFSTTVKEDALLTFFWVLAIYFFIKSKEDNRYLILTGLAVGFALASKYPALILVGLLLSFYIISRREGNHLPSFSKSARYSVPPCLLSFFISNFPIIFPTTIINGYDHYILLKTIKPPNSGIMMMGHLYLHRPFYWVILYIFVKIPIPTLFFIIIGLAFILKKRHPSTKLLLLWLVFPFCLFSLVDCYTRYILVLCPVLILLAAYGIAQVSVFISSHIKSVKINKKINTKRYISAIITLIICINTINAGMIMSPHYRMYVNEIGGGTQNAGYYFPEDSVYDYYLREAMYYVNEHAPEGSLVAMHVPLVGKYYARSDIKFIHVLELPSNITQWSEYNVSYAIIQDSRIYFENEEQVKNLRIALIPEMEFYIMQNVVVEVYRL
jgi:hypothetical protein